MKFPKPVKRTKTPKPLRAKRWGLSKSKRGTAHSRRKREWGRMAYAHTWPCDVVLSYVKEFGVLVLANPTPGLCDGPREYMHLHLVDDGGVRPPDHQGAIGCRKHHGDIDGRTGRESRRWYTELDDEDRLRLRQRLVARQRARWDEVPWAEQVAWDARRGPPF